MEIEAVRRRAGEEADRLEAEGEVSLKSNVGANNLGILTGGGGASPGGGGGGGLPAVP